MNPNWTLVRRVRNALTVVGVAGAIAACGGSTSQVDPFVAKRVLAFGDETSVLTADGRKYSVNVLDSNGALACATHLIWPQRVALQFNIVFAECNPNARPDTNGLMLAQPGARAADLTVQIDTLVAAGGVAAGDLATVLVGANDVLDLYAQYPARTEADLIAEVRQRGDTAAAQINRLINLGARVLLSTVPDLGLSPFGRAQKAAHTDINRAGLITRLIDAYNVRLRVGIPNDGRRVGLVLADEMVQAMAENPGAFLLNNVTRAICTQPLPDCNGSTLISGATADRSLWADDTHLAYGAQLRLGELAANRARNNPF